MSVKALPWVGERYVERERLRHLGRTSIDFDFATLRLLDRAAKARRTSSAVLAQKIVEIVAVEHLVDAILDDGGRDTA